jgi:hypothetical protein
VRGDPAQLAAEQRAKEKPSGRLPIDEIWRTHI